MRIFLVSQVKAHRGCEIICRATLGYHVVSHHHLSHVSTHAILGTIWQEQLKAFEEQRLLSIIFTGPAIIYQPLLVWYVEGCDVATIQRC